jgi:hypothetical protein
MPDEVWEFHRNESGGTSRCQLATRCPLPQVDSRVSSAPLRAGLYAAAGPSQPWPCGGPAAVLPGNSSGLEPDQLNGWCRIPEPRWRIFR